MCRLSRTIPGSLNHVGNDSPVDDQRGNEKRGSRGVVLVAVHNKDRIECKVSGRTFSQYLTSRPCDLQANLVVLQIISLYFSHCPLHCGLYGVVLLVATLRLCKKFLISFEINEAPLSE